MLGHGLTGMLPEPRPVSTRYQVGFLLAVLLVLVIVVWADTRDAHCWAWDGAEPEYYRYDVPGCDGP